MKLTTPATAARDLVEWDYTSFPAGRLARYRYCRSANWTRRSALRAAFGMRQRVTIIDLTGFAPWES